MLRTIFSIGLFVVLGVFALSFLFNILGGLVGLAMWLLFNALKVCLIGLVVYFVVRVFSPDTARKLRDRFNGTRTY
jgi:antibiotic biosynthesis monooxygenase (ABM) superfamily enzyme